MGGKKRQHVNFQRSIEQIALIRLRLITYFNANDMVDERR